MEISNKILFAFLLIFSIEGFSYTPSAPSSPEKSTKKLQKLQSQIQNLEGHIVKEKKQVKDLHTYLKSLDIDIGHNNEQLRVLEDSISQTSAEVNALKLDYETQLEKKNQHEALLSELLLYTYKNIQQERWHVLLVNKDVSAQLRTNHYYQALSDARKNEIQKLVSDLSNIKATAHSLEQKNLDLKTLHQKEQQKKEELAQQQRSRKAILAEINQQLNKKTKMLSKLRNEHQALEKLLAELNTGLSGMAEYIEPALEFQKAKHDLFFPIQIQPSLLSAVTNHPGQQTKKTYIKVAQGTPVHAIYSGRVVFSEWLRGIGLLLILDHGNGYMSLYGNNDILYKSVGEWVNKTDIIARVGQSGGHSEPGLYFELRKDGLALDPGEWFPTG